MMNQVRELHATVICLQGSKILLVRKEAPEWSLPGGKIDPGETQFEAASRELQEETCLQLTDAQFLGHHILTNEEHWLYRMTVSQSAAPSPSHEIIECRWFEVDDLAHLSLKPTNLDLLRREGFVADRDRN